MKNVFKAMCILAGVLPQLGSAALPYSNAFETADFNGQSILANGSYTNTWTGAGTETVITNIVYTNNLNTKYVGTPIPSSTHNSVLSFTEANLTNAVDGAGTPIVAIDTMLQPSFSQGLDPSPALSNCQFGISFTNGYLALYHGGYTNADALGAGYTQYQKWTVFTNSTPVASGKWVRVTATINYDALPGGYQMVKVAIDGVEQTDSTGCSSADIAATNGGQWFVVAKWNAGAQFNSMVLSGNGKMDDLVINAGVAPDYVTPTNHIPYGWLTFMGVVTNGASSAEMNAAENQDSDGDGMLNWQEYLAGTQPTNPASKLAIISQVISNGTYISWLSSSGALAPYRVDSSTNLTGSWKNELANIPTDPSGTNHWSSSSTNVQSFYRVQIVK